MALSDIHDLINGSPDLRQRFLASRVEACWDILNEDPGTTNHVNRVLWAESVLDSYEAHAQREYSRFLSNSTIQSSGSAATDNDIQFVTNSMVNDWADDFVA